MRNFVIVLISLIFIAACAQTCSATNQIKPKVSEQISIQFLSMTFNFMGKTQNIDKVGKLIFEDKRLIIQDKSSKEAFYIQKITEADNILSFMTKNSKNEKATFFIEFNNNSVSKVKLNMFDMDGIIAITAPISATQDKLKKLYNNKISPCNCNTMNRADGAIITSCDFRPIASDDELEVGMSLLKSNSDIFGSLALRFSNKIKYLENDVDIVLEDGNHIKTSIINQQKAIIGNSELLLAILKLTTQDLEKIKRSGIAIISFELNDNYKRTYEAKTNKDVLIKHYQCLKNN